MSPSCACADPRSTPIASRRSSSPIRPSSRDLRAELGGWLRERPFDESEIEPIILATNEAVANAIEHGHRGQHRVGVEAWTSHESLTVEVRDRGSWRDEPSEPDRGHGLLLIRACMDTITVERSSEGTTVRMQRAMRPLGDRARASTVGPRSRRVCPHDASHRRRRRKGAT